MMMGQIPQRNSDRGSLIDIAVIFCVAATIATLLLVTALVLWLAESIGSLLSALCIVGGSAAIIALILYITALRPRIEAIQYRVESLSNIGDAMRQGFDLIATIIQYVTRK